MTYNEYWQVIDAGLTPEDLIVYKYEDQGVATLEDGLYVLEDNLDDSAFVDKMARFVQASLQGWENARAHTAEADDILLEKAATGVQTEKTPKSMLVAIGQLLGTAKQRSEDARLG